MDLQIEGGLWYDFEEMAGLENRRYRFEFKHHQREDLGYHSKNE